MTRLSTTGRAALMLAQEYGWRVLPLHEPRPNGKCSCGRPPGANHKVGKHPRTAHGYKDATTHPEQIAAWWESWPTANIGAWPGPSGLLVIDVDSAAGADVARSLGDDGRPTLETTTHRGCHRWFRLPSAVAIGNLPRDDLDVRSARGYVLVPPSLHPSGQVYRWRGDLDAIGDVPPQLLETLRAPDVRRAANAARHDARSRPPSSPVRAPDAHTERRILAYADRVGYGRTDGRKNAAFVFAAFLLHDVRLDAHATSRYLAAWNSANAPPLPEVVLMSIHANAQAYGGRRPGSTA